MCACTCCSANVRFVFQPRCLSQPAFLLLFSIRYATQRFASFRLIFLSSFSRSRLPFKHTQAIIIGFLYSHTHSICICIRIGICIFILSLLIGPVCVFLASCFVCLPVRLLSIWIQVNFTLRPKVCNVFLGPCCLLPSTLAHTHNRHRHGHGQRHTHSQRHGFVVVVYTHRETTTHSHGRGHGHGHGCGTEIG